MLSNEELASLRATVEQINPDLWHITFTMPTATHVQSLIPRSASKRFVSATFDGTLHLIDAQIAVTAVNNLSYLVGDIEVLRHAAEQALVLLENEHVTFDFANGNTDSTGTIDEGEVLGRRYLLDTINLLRACLSMPRVGPYTEREPAPKPKGETYVQPKLF